MWTIVLVCGPFCVEQAHKVIGASKLTPRNESLYKKSLKDGRPSHKRCYVTEGKAKMMDPDQLRDYVLINVTDEENPKTADDVDIAIAAHVEREINRLADSAAPKKGNKRGLNK